MTIELAGTIFLIGRSLNGYVRQVYWAKLAIQFHPYNIHIVRVIFDYDISSPHMRPQYRIPINLAMQINATRINFSVFLRHEPNL
ncbi:hypothetical protein HZ99_03165 [Pseudomonas fluorescens]|nr:hypothetical protein HZ99_03165 [Pseudomonas fluorescens]KTC32248.1 hypothetical protein AO239_23615 [Pseudomonas sp. ICMP 19500]